MNRFVIGGVVAVWAALLGAAGSAAPVPKDAGKVEPTPDLKAFFDTVSKGVKDEKWPAEADEKKLRDTPRAVFDRVLKAAEQKERMLPVDFEKLTKLDIGGEFKNKNLDSNYLVTGDVRVTDAKDSVIFASGNVQITSARNCVIVAQNVRCTSVENCVIIAGEYVRATSVRLRNGGDSSVLVAGQWIRTTGMDGTICHVLQPGGLPAPDEVKFVGNGPQRAIRVTVAGDVIYLNDRTETMATQANNCTYLPQKNPIAK